MDDERRDRALLLDMLSYAQEARAMVRGRSYEGFIKDRGEDVPGLIEVLERILA